MCSKCLSSPASIIFSLCLILYFQTIACTQSQTNTIPIQDPIFYSYRGSEDLMALLDSFAVELQNEPNKVAYFSVYRKSDELPGRNFRLFNRIRYYLIENRGIEKNRLIFINGGIGPETGFLCFIMPPNTEQLPKSVEPDISENQTYKFDSYYYAMPYDICAYEIGCLEGEYHLAQIDGFAEVLKKRGNVKAYIIGYGSYRSSKLESSKVVLQMLNTEKSHLIKKHGIESSKIILINGGYRKTRSVDLWIVPPDGTKPTLTPDIFPPKQKKKRKS